MRTTVLAAGAVLWLPGVSGGAARHPAEPRFCWFEPLLALVHRPKYDDWSYPKGKLDLGEHVTAAAVREVAEETGLDIRLGPPLGTQRYWVENGERRIKRGLRALRRIVEEGGR